MTRDHKDIFNDTYYAALDDGATDQQATKLATLAAQRHIESLYEQAARERNETSTTPDSSGKEF